MAVVVTGAAGFIGFHLCARLLARGARVVGIDDLNPYYDVALKRNRLAALEERPGFSFHQADIADERAMAAIFARARPIRRVAHFAAQAGVRYSLENPMAYARANLVGQLVILELCRREEGFEHLVYASSSSVYGGNSKLPYAVSDPVDRPISLYAATKRAGELMSRCYGHLYRFPQTGLRLFTVYGPWGRPDMAAYRFTEAILAGTPIKLFNHGRMKRDFTYIDDIIDGVAAALDRVPDGDGDGEDPPWRLYNLGNNRPEPLLRFVELLETALGRKAARELLPMQPGDVAETFADIEAARRDLGFAPRIPIDEGIPRFVEWYRAYHRL